MDEITQLIEMLADYEKERATYSRLAETGNSEGEHKDIYRAKRDAYSYIARRLRNHLIWFGHITEKKK